MSALGEEGRTISAGVILDHVASESDVIRWAIQLATGSSGSDKGSLIWGVL